MTQEIDPRDCQHGFADTEDSRAEQPIQSVMSEPVAWMSANQKSFVHNLDIGDSVPNWTDYYTIPLYAAPQPCSRCAGYVDEITTLKREVERLNAIKFQRFNNEDCWIYQGDGEDHLESLTCPVVIPADKLAALEAALKGWSDETTTD